MPATRPPRPTAAVAAAAALATSTSLLVGVTATGSASASSLDPAETIPQIQGRAQLSPYDDKPVNAVAGVVTAVRTRGGNGFYLQTRTPDQDPGTSEAIFVFTRTAPTVAVGAQVLVDGTVEEFRPGGATSDNLTTTEIIDPRVTPVATGVALPATTVLGPGGRVAPAQTIEDDASGDVEAQRDFDPATDAIDFYESLEAMRVQVNDAEVVAPTSDFGEIWTLPAGTTDVVRSRRGGVVYSGYDRPNAARLQLDDELLPSGSVPQADVGDRIPGATVGVVDYSFGNVEVLVTAPPRLQKRFLPREVTEQPGRRELAVGTFNVENLDPGDPARTYERLAQTIVTSLAAPDLLALEEVQDNNGATNDALVAADATYARLIDAIARAGGPRYEFRQIDPVDDQDGGEPGGNIRVGFLFRTDRGLSFVDRPGGTATTATQVRRERGDAVLSVSPGRVDPANPAWASSRKPLAGEFRWRGRTLIVVANHFSSKGGDDPLFGRVQPPVRSSEAQRHRQATLVRDFVRQVYAADRNARLVVLGDINDFEFSRTADILTSAPLLDLPRTLPRSQRYTYVFEGNSQVLDHILISPRLVGRARRPGYEYDIVHVNAEYADQVSDHDPQVVRLDIR